jgi:hypothetical protein
MGVQYKCKRRTYRRCGINGSHGRSEAVIVDAVVYKRLATVEDHVSARYLSLWG